MTGRPRVRAAEPWQEDRSIFLEAKWDCPWKNRCWSARGQVTVLCSGVSSRTSLSLAVLSAFGRLGQSAEVRTAALHCPRCGSGAAWPSGPGGRGDRVWASSAGFSADPLCAGPSNASLWLLPHMGSCLTETVPSHVGVPRMGKRQGKGGRRPSYRERRALAWVGARANQLGWRRRRRPPPGIWCCWLRVSVGWRWDQETLFRIPFSSSLDPPWVRPGLVGGRGQEWRPFACSRALVSGSSCPDVLMMV